MSITPTERIVRVESGEMVLQTLERAGEPTLFFIHGIGCTKEAFEPAFRASSLEQFGLFAVDLPGFGGSGRDASWSYSIEFFRDVCEAALAGVTGSIHLVGHSMGGAVAILLSGRLGRRAGLNISVEGNLVGDDCRFVTRRTVKYTERDFLEGGFNQIRQDARQATSPGERLWVDWLELADARAFYRSAASLVAWSDSGRLLSQYLENPRRSVYIYGDRNAGAEAVAQLGEVSRHEIPRSGHFPMNDNPDHFYEVLARVISENRDEHDC